MIVISRLEESLEMLIKTLRKQNSLESPLRDPERDLRLT